MSLRVVRYDRGAIAFHCSVALLFVIVVTPIPGIVTSSGTALTSVVAMLIDRDTVMPGVLVVPAMVVAIVEALARLDDTAAR